VPHVIVKLWPGKTEQQKRRLSDAIVESITRIFKYGEESVSVAFVEVPPNEWAEKVYRPDIQDAAATLTKKPGYTM
jgi:4-oxalocrotonate tautomerase